MRCRWTAKLSSRVLDGFRDKAFANLAFSDTLITGELVVGGRPVRDERTPEPRKAPEAAVPASGTNVFAAGDGTSPLLPAALELLVSSYTYTFRCSQN